MRVELDQVTKTYGARRVADGVTLACGSGELFALLGPSGSGKSTLLHMVAGLVTPDSGRILFGERVVNDPAIRVPSRGRGVGMVFQELALWPHMTVTQHLRFVAPTADPQELLDALALTGHAHARPAQLSGGEAQRLAIARALVTGPRLLLLDEPLAALDRRLCEQLLELIVDMHRLYGKTTIYVTHAYEEAFGVADRVGVMVSGRLVQVGTPQEIYESPRSETVARLTGPVSSWPLPDGSTALVRPESIIWQEDQAGLAKVRTVRYLGGRWEIEAALDGRTVRAIAPRKVSGSVSLALKPSSYRIPPD
ncbi:ABC transporter ATP-binding protein [Planctomycetota bacterium]